MRILLIEDEVEMAAVLRTALSRHGYVVDWVANIDDARVALRDPGLRVVLLDRRLPDGDGLILLPVVAALPDPPSVIVLTARGQIDERVAGLDAGAEDYLVKPFKLEELLARLRVVTRRRATGMGQRLVLGALSFDPAHREAQVDGLPLPLPRRELALLELLLRRANRMVLREAIEAAVFGFDDAPVSNTLDSHVSRLRRRLAESGAGVTIHALRGVGYMAKAE
ncbi:response regulator transcription factor [Roseomonas hellenica]|uniref:Response regulator transcription factor n=1 Tax=Plastoroseomonas hellenica TaxID=2687306 RepID=A0ABS5EUF4_9PROT|nr:response regulator transcription factor [Plastoroseomonas hellenica]MBR0663926.1 response regulator transcription factor [Plastoroseomonas hellenica]